MTLTRIKVEVVYAHPDQCVQLICELDRGAVASDAIKASGVLKRELDLASDDLRLGIFGQRIEPDHRLQDGDRVEIYRPLQLSPTEARRLRAKRRPRQDKPQS